MKKADLKELSSFYPGSYFIEMVTLSFFNAFGFCSSYVFNLESLEA